MFREEAGEGASGAGMRPVQLPCSLGTFWDKAERVRHRGRGRILPLAPCLLQLPRPAAPPTLSLGDPRNHLTSPKTTQHPQIFPPQRALHPGNSSPPPPNLEWLWGAARSPILPQQHLLVQNTLFGGTLHCAIQAELFWGSSALPWAEPRIRGPRVGWGAHTAPGPPVLISAAVMGSNAIFPGGCHGSTREVTK